MTRTGTGKVAGYNELGTEDCPGLASVATITYLQEQLALRDKKFVAMEQSISQLKHAVRDLQQRSWQPMLIIDITDMQRPIKILGSYTMNHQDNDNKWGFTSTANDESRFSGVKDDERIAATIILIHWFVLNSRLWYNSRTILLVGTVECELLFTLF